MSKILEATCVAGVVTVDGIPLTSATVFSEGVAQSEGLAILDELDAFYIAKVTPDLKTLLERTIDALTQVKTALDKTVEAVNKAATGMTLIDAKPTGGTASAVTPVATTDILGITTASALVTAAATQINAIKTQLTTLNGALR